MSSNELKKCKLYWKIKLIKVYKNSFKTAYEFVDVHTN